jgi:hypothetical protein
MKTLNLIPYRKPLTDLDKMINDLVCSESLVNGQRCFSWFSGNCNPDDKNTIIHFQGILSNYLRLHELKMLHTGLTIYHSRIKIAAIKLNQLISE